MQVPAMGKISKPETSSGTVKQSLRYLFGFTSYGDPWSRWALSSACLPPVSCLKADSFPAGLGLRLGKGLSAPYLRNKACLLRLCIGTALCLAAGLRCITHFGHGTSQLQSHNLLAFVKKYLLHLTFDSKVAAFDLIPAVASPFPHFGQ